MACYCYPTIDEVPGNVDLVVIVVPAKRVLDVVDQCGRKGCLGGTCNICRFFRGREEGKERQQLLREKVFSYRHALHWSQLPGHH